MGLEGLADPRSGEDCVKGVPQLTQWYTRHLENVIRRAPDQYWWLHRRWKDNRPAKRRGKLAA
jgi:KDO2-lipid IV(A) lauroyltransferase